MQRLLGEEVRYAYTGDDLTEASISDGTTTTILEQYSYLTAHLLERITHDGASIVENNYDAQRRVSRQYVDATTTINYRYDHNATDGPATN